MHALYLTRRFFLVFICIAVGFVISFQFSWLLFPMQELLIAACAIWLLDALLLYSDSIQISAQRKLPKVTSLGDHNPVHISIHNAGRVQLKGKLIDELPIELQERDFMRYVHLKADEKQLITYQFRPTSRGEYQFGYLNLLLATPIGFWYRRFRPVEPAVTPVYPSIIQMKEMELRLMHQLSNLGGIKKMRRLGHSYEFEQVKNYTEGDDYRHINWRASGKHASLMVNQFIQEKSQNVYCIVDKSRVMHMPFDGLSLLDYSINATLALSNIIIKKEDKVGLFTFSNVMGSTIQADHRNSQLGKLLEALYKERPRKVEANYELLYQATRKLLSVRALLILFTNFESIYALERQLPYLRRINKSHLLTVVFFENSEIETLAQLPAMTHEGIFEKSVARKYVQDKKEIVRRLKQFGIQVVLTKPQDLSVATINKYLELKARGLV